MSSMRNSTGLPASVVTLASRSIVSSQLRPSLVGPAVAIDPRESAYGNPLSRWRMKQELQSTGHHVHPVVSYCSRILCMPRGNPSPKLAITIDPDIHKRILAAAARDRMSVSAWMTAAARLSLQRRAGLAAVALWEKQHGRFTAEEMDQARRRVLAQLRASRTVRRSA